MKFEFFFVDRFNNNKKRQHNNNNNKALFLALSLSLYRKNATTIFKTQKRGENKTLINDWRIV